jgi:hypothetical protein
MKAVGTNDFSMFADLRCIDHGSISFARAQRRTREKDASEPPPNCRKSLIPAPSAGSPMMVKRSAIVSDFGYPAEIPYFFATSRARQHVIAVAFSTSRGFGPGRSLDAKLKIQIILIRAHLVFGV